MKPSEALTKAREILQNKEHWTKGEFARDELQRHVHRFSSKAVCWCAEGAIYKAWGTVYVIDSLWEFFSFLNRPLSVFNDDPTTTHAMVLEAFDKAIELAKEKENEAQ